MYCFFCGSDFFVYNVWYVLWKKSFVFFVGMVELSIDGEKERIEIRNGDYEFVIGFFISIFIVFFDFWWCMLDFLFDW